MQHVFSSCCIQLKNTLVNYPDLIVITIIATGSWVGYKLGFIRTLFFLLKWVIAGVAAYFFYIPFSPIVKEGFALQEQWLYPLTFGIIFGAVYIIIHILEWTSTYWIKSETDQSLLNKRAGILPGIITGFCFAVVLVKLMLLSQWQGLSVPFRNSTTASVINYNTVWLNAAATDIFNNSKPGTKISDAFEAKEGMNQSPEFKCDQYTEKPDLETQLLDLVNTERIKYQLRPVKADLLLQQVAAAHAADMFTNGYFAHNNREGKTPFDRMRESGVDYMTAGENLAHSYDLQSAHTGLMNSQGHRENILNPKFGRLGISILDGGENGLMIVEEFRN